MINDVMADIEQLFQHFGDKTYGEACSQLTHAISSAWHAQQQQAPQSLVCAAFLHDIGHFIADQRQMAGLDQWGHVNHDVIASDWLQQQGFPASVYLPIRYHVQAKRYVARTMEPSTLSKASFQTLQQQGGPMTDDEALAFERLSGFAEAIELRRYDDLGKPCHTIDVSITPWLALTKQVLIGN
ncbi:HD family phosphohydrolase [Thalassotalea marina]|uniref:HD domain-containing protein n=1 Tax=Thalassotalea marina TaxID=1673741 RepID=A0A919BIG6_9GAMM|nr:HD family phosphohydrolase [Thalassotalea marina]GHF89973.1 hypothetical protein GCM10017161_17440 [Thalassotalea marina]